MKETVASIIGQSCEAYRVVVSDNGSEPEAAHDVRRFVEGLEDPRVTFVQQSVNGGEYGQGRYFLREAGDDEFFVIVHDDDLLEPQHLARAVAALKENPQASVYVANPLLVDETGQPSQTLTARYLRDHGRSDAAEGLFDMLTRHFATGFTPISGTLFRTADLHRSGFVDDDCFGNFPFEFNIMVRLGDIGAKGWFDPVQGLRVRYHDGQLRNTLGLMRNPDVVATMRRILERRSYSGFVERRRRQILSRLHRAEAEIAHARGDVAAARSWASQARCAYHLSPRAWLFSLRLMLSRG